MVSLKLAHVSKRYYSKQPAGGSRNSDKRKIYERRQEFWAVRDVCFDVKAGEAVGIIGNNGSGKSTILKLISRITAPTSGEIRINGQLSALIELGSGFHPDLTGRENIYLNGSILGMPRREITEKIESIIDFAGVGQFIDVVVKRYSSGMYLRLGFSVAAHMKSDILLLDEVLAVGDAAFQAKCLQRIEELKKSGKTLIFVSHDLSAVERLCDRALLMDRGQVAADGTPQDVIIEYQRVASRLAQSALTDRQAFAAPRDAEIISITLYDSDGQAMLAFRTGEWLSLCVTYIAHGRITDVAFEVSFYSLSGRMSCSLSTESVPEQLDIEKGEGVVKFSCAQLCLRPGFYYVNIAIKRPGSHDGAVIDLKKQCVFIRVDHGKPSRGSFYMPYEWELVVQNDGHDG